MTGKYRFGKFVFQNLNIGKWSTMKRCDGVAVVKKRENHCVKKVAPFL